MKCSICFEPINILYYKSSCNCKAYYHINCILEWYSIKQQCIYCKKKDNIDIYYLKNKQNKIYELLAQIIIVFITLFFIYFIMI